MKNIVFFVHYSSNNGIGNHTKYTLENIRDMYDEVVIISNSKLNDRDIGVLDGFCDKLIIRGNIGYDFAAWRDGMKKIGWSRLEKYSSVTLMNDTCYFPLFPVEDTITKFNKSRGIDFWGASMHKEAKRGMPGSNGAVPEHLQSYFMTFKRNVVKSRTFQNFWDRVKNLEDVDEVIRKYETRLTARLSREGFRYGALYNPNDYDDETVINATYQIPELLIRRRFPFLKIKAVSINNKDAILEELNKTGSTYPAKYIAIRQNPLKGVLRYLIKHTHWLFLAIAIPASVAFMVITPIGFGGDEESHLYRAYHISTGHLYPENLNHGNSGLLPINLIEAAKQGYATASDSPFGVSLIGRRDIDENKAQRLQLLAKAPLNPNDTRMEKFSNTTAYAPIAYIGAAFGFKLSVLMDLSVGWSVFLARLINAMPFFAISSLALYVLRGAKLRWLVFFVLLLPTVISYVATINGDPYNIASVMLFFALFITHVTSRQTPLDRRSKALLITSAILLAFAKLPSVALTLLMVFIPSIKFGGRKKKWISTICVFLLVGLLSLISLLAVGSSGSNGVIKQQMHWMLQNPIGLLDLYATTLFVELADYINRAVGVMGRNGVFLHQTVVMLIVTWLIILGLWLDKGSKKIATLSFATGIALCFIVMTLLYLADNKGGASTIWGVHGKYFTPFIPFIVYGFTALPISVTSRGRYIEYGTLSVSILVLLASIITYNLALY